MIIEITIRHGQIMVIIKFLRILINTIEIELIDINEKILITTISIKSNLSHTDQIIMQTNMKI